MRRALCLLFALFLLTSLAIRPVLGYDTPGPEPRVLTFGDPLTAEAAALGDESTGQPPTAQDRLPAEAGQPVPPSHPPLSAEMATLRDHLRRSLGQVYARPLTARDHLPAEIIAFCEAFGPEAEIGAGGSNQRINGVGALCWNFPCGGYSLLRTADGAVLAQVGYGYQQRPGQLLAMLASNSVPPAYEIRVGETIASVADLVESEKRACRSNLNLSATLIGLSFYVQPDAAWQNDSGQTWSIERLLREELDRTANSSSIDVVDRLMGLSFAVQRISGGDLPSDELLKRAGEHIAECQEFAFELQNDDGSWHPGFFAFRGSSNDAAGALHATGAILAWLVFSLPEDRLDDPRVVRALQFVIQQASARASARAATPTSTREVVGLMKVARALSLYDSRYLTPRSPSPEAAASAPAQTSTQAVQSPPRTSTGTAAAATPSLPPKSPTASPSSSPRRTRR